MTLPPYANQSTSSVDILKIFANDKHLILYRPEWKQVTGSVLATILLSQILYWWDKQNRQPFYKFKEPCQHPLYISGDSWCEELGFSRREFDTALKLLKSKGFVESSTDINRVTHYSVNQEILEPVFTELYLKAECAFTKIPNAPLPPIITETTTKTTTTEPPKQPPTPLSDPPLPPLSFSSEDEQLNELITLLSEQNRKPSIIIVIQKALKTHPIQYLKDSIHYTNHNCKSPSWSKFKAYLGRCIEYGWGEGYEPDLQLSATPVQTEAQQKEQQDRTNIRARHEALNKFAEQQPDKYETLAQQAAQDLNINLKKLKPGDQLKLRFKIMDYLNL